MGYDPDAAPDYGLSPDEIATIPLRLTALAKAMGSKNLAQRLGISAFKLRQFKSANANLTGKAREISLVLISQMENYSASIKAIESSELEKIQKAVDSKGWRPVAREIGVDVSNLRRKLRNANRTSDR